MKLTLEVGTIPILITILFILLKMFGGINWSWMWVLSPIPIAMLVGSISEWALRRLK